MIDSLEERRNICILGDYGTGKTVVIQSVAEKLRNSGRDLVYINALDTTNYSGKKYCKTWEDVVRRAGLWKKLANGFALESEQDRVALEQKGLRKVFEEEGSFQEESKHFRDLCEKFGNYKVNWRTIRPKETLLCCAPSEVNKTFGFSWNPNWFWANQDGWICSFKVQGDLLLVGVIETLQVMPVNSRVVLTNPCLTRFGICPPLPAWQSLRLQGMTLSQESTLLSTVW